MADFFAPENAPFAVALVLLALIALVEVAGLMLGTSPSGLIDQHMPDIEADADVMHPEVGVHDGPQASVFERLLGWLSIGRVPILVLLIVFLSTFGVAGLIVQQIARGVLGMPLPALVASLPALAAALPSMRYAGRGLARIMPKEETQAVSQRSFIGKVAVITRGEARRGLPAEAKLRDAFGHAHYVLVEPDEESVTFAQGTEVLIVSQTGIAYRVIANAHEAMSDRPQP